MDTDDALYEYARADHTPQRTGNWIYDHWHGALNLAPAYWINVFLVGFVLNVMAAAFENSNDTGSLQTTATISLAIWGTAIALSIWGIVGVWRSANHHVARGGNKGWATLAQIVCILGALSLVGNLLSGREMYAETTKLAAGYDSLGDGATFALEGNSIAVSGMLTVGSAVRFEEFLASAPQANRLELLSGGGRIQEAADIAEIVSRRGMDTHVTTECSSACVTIFLAGRNRMIGPDAALGFHSPTYPGLTPQEEADMERLERERMGELGLSQAFIDRTMNTLPESMWYPGYKELFRENVVNGIDAADMAVIQAAGAREADAETPTKLDGNTTLFKVSADGTTVIYDYQLVDVPFGINVDVLERDVSLGVCGNEEMAFLIRYGGSYRYRYFQPGETSAEADFTIDRCRQTTSAW
ncbi:MAG: hypothetical protein EVA34_04190 [Erythrobacter sp.]|nr:MAG: hypothetical protein EVA34_04190 [Erythrobacter sp.]